MSGAVASDSEVPGLEMESLMRVVAGAGHDLADHLFERPARQALPTALSVVHLRSR